MSDILAPGGEIVVVRAGVAELGEVNVSRREIDVIAVPWDQEAEVPVDGEWWREVFRRGAFDGIESHAGRVRVNREHKIGDTVGKVVRFENGDGGLMATVKVAKTARGDDTLGLAEDGAISASIGYYTKKATDIVTHRRTMLREVKRAFLHHLGLVESPAFAGASVLGVREEQPEPTGETPEHAHALNDAFQHPAYLAALERLAQVDTSNA